MEIPALPFAIGGVVLTFAVAVLGWWVASRVERRRRTARRLEAGRRPPPRDLDGPPGTRPPS